MQTHTSGNNPLRQSIRAYALGQSIVLSFVALVATYYYRLPITMFSIAIAPLFLLRTPDSTHRAFEMLSYVAPSLYGKWRFIAAPVLVFQNGLSTGERGPLLRKPALMPVGILYLLLAYLVMFVIVSTSMYSIRIAATLIESWKTFPKCLSAIPSNYARLIYMTTIMEEAVLIPGVEYADLTNYGIDNRIIDFLRPWKRIRSALKDFSPVIVVIGLPLYMILIVLPSVIARVMIKASLFFYGHLVYLLHTTLTTSVKEKIDSQKSNVSLEFMKIWSVVTGAVLLGKLFLLSMSHGEMSRFEEKLVPGIVKSFLAASTFPWWQLAALFASITFWLKLFLMRKLQEYAGMSRGNVADRSRVTHRRLLRRCFRTVYFINKVLACYVLIWNLSNIVYFVRKMEWPKFGGPLFPWGE